MKITTLIIICAGIIFSIIVFIKNKMEGKKAEEMLNNGDLDGALSQYKMLFVDAFAYVINSEGEGHVPSFIHTLKNKGRKHLEHINTILQRNGQSIETFLYEELIQDVEQFSKQKGVMNYKKVPVKEGKIQFAEFYRRLMSFSESIPEHLI